MKAVVAILVIFISQWALSFPGRNPVFGVYRGLAKPNQDCTLTIMQHDGFSTVSILIDQDSHLFIDGVQLMDSLTKNTLKMHFQGVERSAQDQVDIEVNPKTRRLNVTSNVKGATARCLDAFQIRKQD